MREATVAVLDMTRLEVAPVRSEPFDWFAGTGVLNGAAPAVAESFPEISTTGFHPVEDDWRRGAFGELLATLESDEFSRAVGDKLGLDLSDKPQLITVRKLSARHEGRVHTDSDKKLASFLIYLNDKWTSTDGRFRILRGPKLEDTVVEVPPETGAFVGFRRADNSWHGHTPFVGERRVVQVAWLRDQAAVDRKKRTHGLGGLLKTMFKRAA
jgi:hypothetical protein